MTQETKDPSFISLRNRAEHILLNRGVKPNDTADFDFVHLIHEFEVYQVELELQNEELRHAAAELESARNKYFELYDSAPVGFVTVKRNGNIERCNTTATQMLGIPEAALIGRAFLTRVFRKDHRSYLACLKNLVMNEKAAPCELRLVRDDGSLIHVHLEAVVKKDSAGSIIDWRLALVDVTESKQAEALRISEKHFREAFVYAPIGMALLDPGKRFVHVNDTFCQMIGYGREELVGTGLTDLELICPEDVDVTADALKRLIDGEIPAFFLENRYFRKDEAIVWVRTSATLRRDAAGKPMQIVKMFEDITLRKEVEEQLRQSQKMEAIGRLAGGVAHEFNNMLNVIHGNAELLGMRLEKDNPLQKHIREITTATQRSADMADHLLTYSRKQERAPQVININEVIEKQKWMLQRLIGEAVDIHFRPGDLLWPVRFDPSQFDQILTNLAVNSRDAIADTGKVTIATENIRLDRFDATLDLPPGDYVQLVFMDSGSGMDEMICLRIFDPYYTTKDVGKGTGLGLAAVYGIVKQNRGGIRVWSKPGKGTTFHLYFPRSTIETDRTEVETDQISTARGETVLIVEDETQVLELAKEILEAAGYHVLTAATPEAAVDLVRRSAHRIDLLLTDMIMPEMNGRDLKKIIETIHPHVPTLFMSGYTDEIVTGKEISMKGADFIGKPFTVGALTRKVREIIEQREP